MSQSSSALVPVTPGWFSLTFRYAAISLVAAIVPLISVGIAYDRYSTGLIDRMTGERLERRLAAMSGRISDFVDARFNQLDTLVHYPDIGHLVAPPGTVGDLGSDVRSVLEYEADNPDLYGILVFDAGRNLVSAFPSQSASGPPYWGAGDLPLEGAPRATSDRGEIIGPIGPAERQAGSLVLLHEIPGHHPSPVPLGWIGLHVRLASLTEFLAPAGADDFAHAVLMAPDGRAYAAVGVAEQPAGEILHGPSVMPGWEAALVIERNRLSEPLFRVRSVLAAMVLALVVGLVSLFLVLWVRISGRVDDLIGGSRQLAAGRLETRLKVRGRDEISLLAGAFNAMAERLQAVVRARMEAEKMAALGRFATSVAHEIRNPLATLKTSVQGLILSEPQAERREILTGIDEEIDRLDDTLHDLLDYARPRPPKPARIAMRRILRRIEMLAGPALAEQGINLVCLGDADAVIVADPAHVQQILTNLVLNAREAMPNGGILKVRSARAGPSVAIEISDTGIGMPADVLARATDAFFTTRPHGTGLGLAISKQLVELNRGQISIDSQPGRGTVVTVRFPTAEEYA